MKLDALRFLGFILILFVYVNNVFSLLLGIDDHTALVDTIILTVFYGIVLTLAQGEEHED